jgi:Cd2+/Zn2+-exporting ATPase
VIPVAYGRALFLETVVTRVSIVRAAETEVPDESGPAVRRYRVLSGCVECAGDLAPIRRLDGVRDVELLAATGTLVVQADPALEDKVLVRTASASGISLAPEAQKADAQADEGRRRTQKWYLRPDLILQRIAFVFMLAADLVQRLADNHTVAVPLALVAILVGIYYPARSAWTMLKAGKFSLNLLLIVAVVGAVYLGKFTEAACVVVIFTLGVLLESYIADRARKSIQGLMDLSPARAERFEPDGTVELVPVEQLAVGDLVLVRPGSRLPTDGTVVDGTSWIDTSAITGESMPVDVGPGAAVYGGTLNGQSALRIQVTRPFEDTVLARTIREVEEAQQNRGKAQRLADKFAGIYTPLMIALALLTAIAGPALFDITWEQSLYRALVVLIVSCSCSLVLSVPVSVVAAIARAARDGVLIKGGIYLERLSKIRSVAFDKTGTLTRGRPTLTVIRPVGTLDELELLRFAASVEASASHPIADAVVRAARERGVAVIPAKEARVVAGLGAEGVVTGRAVAVGRVGDVAPGSPAGQALADIESVGSTAVAITVDGRLVGLLGVADELREDASVAIEGLRRLGITHTTMLTGDREIVARAIADRLGIENVRAQLMPEDKSAAIRSIRAEYDTVAMVGDGINDAPALAVSDVGVVMGAAGTDVALETADVALMADDLGKLPYAVALARRADRIIKQNIALSLTAIVGLVVAAVTGYFTLAWGVFVNEAWALLVIANGLRLLRATPLLAYGANPRTQAEPAAVASSADAPVAVSSAGCTDESCGCATVEATASADTGFGDGCGCSTGREGQAPAADDRAPQLAVLETESSGATCADGSCGCGTGVPAAPQRTLQADRLT